MSKLRHNRGETLVEVLASILISALSVALLFSCVTASSKTDTGTEKSDEKHYTALTAADGDRKPAGISEGTVTIQREDSPFSPMSSEIHINIYGDEGMYSYEWSEEP